MLIFSYTIFSRWMFQSIDLENGEKIDIIKLHKMAFIYNALENGWKVKKKMETVMFLQKIMEAKKKYF